MADPQTITDVADAWTFQGVKRPNTGSNRFVQTQNGIRRGWLMPSIPALAGETVLSAVLRGHVKSSPATTYHLDAITGKWSAGKITHDSRPTVDAVRRASATTGALSDGDTVEFDITTILAGVAGGLPWWGLRLVSESATVTSWYATDSGEPAWELDLVLAEESEGPDNLRPDGGAVGSDRPTLAWDAEGQVAFRVDLFADDETGTVTWSSGWVAEATSLYDLPAGAPAGGWHWEVTVRDTDDAETTSDRAFWTVSGWADLIVDSPTGVFGDTSPTVAAHPASGEVGWWSLMVTGPSRADVRFELGVQSGPIDTVLPEAVRGRRLFTEGETCQIGITWSDGVSRAAAVGDPTSRTVWVDAVLGSSGTVDPVSSLSVTPFSEGDARLVWQWSRTEAADAWLLCVDGKWVRRVSAEEVEASGGWYTFRDRGDVQPMRPHAYSVLAVEGDARSEAGVTATGSHVVTGFWVLDPEGVREPIVLEGTGVGGIDRADQIATYTTVEGEEHDVIYGRPGYKGEFTGSVSVNFGRGAEDVWAALDEVDALIDDPSRLRQVVWASRSIRARLRSPGWRPESEILERNLLHAVSFGLVESGRRAGGL